MVPRKGNGSITYRAILSITKRYRGANESHPCRTRPRNDIGDEYAGVPLGTRSRPFRIRAQSILHCVDNGANPISSMARDETKRYSPSGVWCARMDPPTRAKRSPKNSP